MENNAVFTGVDSTLEGVKKFTRELGKLEEVVRGMREGLAQIETGLVKVRDSQIEVSTAPVVLDSDTLVEHIVSGVAEVLEASRAEEDLDDSEESSVKIMDILLEEERTEKPTFRGNVSIPESVEEGVREEITTEVIEEDVEEEKELEKEDTGFKTINAELKPDVYEEGETESADSQEEVLKEISQADDIKSTEVYGVALNDLRVADLGEVLRELDLPVSGKKQALVDRIVVAHKSEEFTEEEMKSALQAGIESSGADVEDFEEIEDEVEKLEVEKDLVDAGEEAEGIEFKGRVLDRATWLEVLDSIFEGVTDELTDEDIIDNLRVADEEGMLNWEEEGEKESPQEEELVTYSNEREAKEIDVYNSVIEEFNDGKIKITEIKAQIDKYYDGDPTAKKAKDLTTEEAVQTLAEIKSKLVDDEADVHDLEDVYVRDGKWMCCGRELKQSKENDNEMFCEICGIIYEF